MFLLSLQITPYNSLSDFAGSALISASEVTSSAKNGIFTDVKTFTTVTYSSSSSSPVVGDSNVESNLENATATTIPTSSAVSGLLEGESLSGSASTSTESTVASQSASEQPQFGIHERHGYTDTFH